MIEEHSGLGGGKSEGDGGTVRKQKRVERGVCPAEEIFDRKCGWGVISGQRKALGKSRTTISTFLPGCVDVVGR